MSWRHFLMKKSKEANWPSGGVQFDFRVWSVLKMSSVSEVLESSSLSWKKALSWTRRRNFSTSCLTENSSCCIQGFWYFARSRSPEFQVNPRNPAKFTKTREIPRSSLEIFRNTCRHNIFWKWSWLLGLLLTVNLLIYLKTSSLQRVNNIPKLPGVLRLMLREPGKQRCKNPGVAGFDRGN